MESHGSPDIRMQRSYMQQHGPRGSQEFGVRVQVQGIKGQPFVVLNSSGQESHRDISVITHQAGYNPGMVRRSVDERLVQRSSPSEMQRTAASSVFHYQKHPEILRPYDPDRNNLNLVLPSQTASVTLNGQKNDNLIKPRIPLPAEAPAGDQGEVAPSDRQSPTRSPNSVDSDSFMSVGKLITQFNNSQRRGRGGPRNRLDPEQTRRSRSVDSGRTSDSSSSSSSRASSLKGFSSKSPGGVYPPGSARARLLGGETTLVNKSENKSSSHDMMSPKSEKLLHRAKESSVSCSDESDERETQVTPDLLKGQQEMSVDPTEDTAKRILFTYLKDGTTDDDTITKRKVNLLLERMNKLKWKTAENVEEEDKDHTAEVKQLQEKEATLERELSALKQKLGTEMKNEKTLAKACEKARTEKKTLQEELARTQAELSKLRERLSKTEAELQFTKQE